MTRVRSAALVLLSALLSVGPVRAQGRAAAAPADTITLEEALAEARSANLRLPVARLALEQSLDRLRQAEGALWPTLFLDGDLHPGAPRTYESSDARVRVVAEGDVYDGGALRAAVRSGRARSEAARSDYRGALRDVELAVRSEYARCLRGEREIELQQEGVSHLERYRTAVRSRLESAEGLGADLSRTRSELAGARADLDAAEQAYIETRMELNVLLGRDPNSALHLAPLPEPSRPPAPARPGEAPWTLTPDVRSVLSSVDAAEAGMSGARSGRRPHLGFTVAAGGQAALVDPAPALMNDGRGWGVEAMLTLSLPLWGRTHRGRMAEARDALAQARAEVAATRESARLEFDRADARLRARFREIAGRRAASSSARDAFLQTESLYRGGTGTALEVLDAHRSWLAAARAEADAVLDYRLAEARRIRWGTR